MTIDRFSKSDFEQALTDILNVKDNGLSFIDLGLDKGEYTYAIPVKDTNKRLMIRSSVKSNGFSAGAGKDSIRLYVQYFYKSTWRPLAKLDAYTTRVPGWQTRMGKKLRELYRLALADSAGHKQVPNETLSGEQMNKENEQTKNDDVSSGVSLTDPAGGESEPLAAQAAPPQAPPVSPFSPGETVTETDDTDDEQQAAGSLSTPVIVPNAQQLAAIQAPVNAAIRVLAGPGSGKTFCVARRYAHLLANGAQPTDILAVTFNKTMADELLSRIIKVNPSVRGTDAEKQVCTIHALCYRLLRATGDRRNVAKEWQVKKIMTEIAEKLWPYADDRPGYKEILAWINGAKAQGLTTADDLNFFSKCIDKNGRNAGRKLHQARRQFDDGLRRNVHYKTKRPESLLTFADMPLDVERKLTTDRSFREKYQARFKWVVVDEGQDTSAQAMRILSTLAEPQKQFYIVGDTDQLLYRFAGAMPEANLYEGFEERYPDGELVKLSINYRSTQAIISTQFYLIQENYDKVCLKCEGEGFVIVDSQELSCGRCNSTGIERAGYDLEYLKLLAPRPDAPQGQPVTFAMHPSPQAEAESVVNTIVERLVNGGQPGDIFIGARTRAQLGYLEGPLVRAQIPSINLCGGSFWGSKHIQDVVGYLRLAHNGTDREAFKRVFNIASSTNIRRWGKNKGEYCQHRYLGAAFLSACNESYTQVHKAAQNWRFKAGIEDLESLIYHIQGALECADKLGDVVKFIIEACYKRFLQAEEGLTDNDDDSNKLDDLDTVIDVANQFDDVADFIKYVADAEQAVADAKNKDWSKYVILSTWHRLKGLERDVVFGIGVCEGLGADGVTPAGLLPHTFSMTDPPQNGILPTSGRGRIADERCILFVGVSRARNVCYLSGVESYRKSQMGPSRFISEMGLGG